MTKTEKTLREALQMMATRYNVRMSTDEYLQIKAALHQPEDDSLMEWINREIDGISRYDTPYDLGFVRGLVHVKRKLRESTADINKQFGEQTKAGAWDNTPGFVKLEEKPAK